jgi:hypothetical protein
MIDKTKRAVSTGVLEDGDDGAFGRKRQNNKRSARGCCEMPRSIARVRRVEGGVGWTGALGRRTGTGGQLYVYLLMEARNRRLVGRDQANLWGHTHTHRPPHPAVDPRNVVGWVIIARIDLID